MLTVEGFLLPAAGLCLETLGLTPGAVFDLCILVLPLTFGNADFVELSFKFGPFLLVVTEEGFEVEGLS